VKAAASRDIKLSQDKSRQGGHISDVITQELHRRGSRPREELPRGMCPVVSESLAIYRSSLAAPLCSPRFALEARGSACLAAKSGGSVPCVSDFGPVHAQPGQPVDMKSDFAPAKIALAAGATGSGRGTTRWCCARPRCCPSTGAPATVPSARGQIVSATARRPRIEPKNGRATCLVEER